MNAEQMVNKISLANKWISPQTLEQELGISLRKQEKLRMKQKDTANSKKPIPYTKIGRNVFYDREKISKWLSENQVNNTLE